MIPRNPGEKVRRHFLTVLGGEQLPGEDTSSGRRALAEWIVAKENPLTARVMANRIWQHHFGRGLVPTPNDFGKQGKPPTHPELLDYLAAKFRDGGWSVKAMHRLIMTLARLSTRHHARATMPSRATRTTNCSPPSRASASTRRAIRDTLLALGGNLDLSPAGAHPFPPQSEWKFTQHNPFKAVYDTNRRSVYLMTQRIQRHPYLAIFDGADPSASTPARTTSTTPLQALYLLNDPFVHEQAKRIAERIFADAGDDGTRVKRTYALLFSRPPDENEISAAEKFITETKTKLGDEKDAWRSYLRVLFRLNEFVYLD